MLDQCFADCGKNCKILEEKICLKGDCPFRKTNKQKEAGRRLWKEKMRALPDERQEHLSWLYFMDKFPWRKGKK